jgi:hypothetical protein
MPDTSSDFFTSVSQGGPGPIWSNTGNVLVTPGFADSFHSSSELRLDTPFAGAEIPAGQIITNIELTFFGLTSDPTLANGNFTITGGSTQQIVLTEAPGSNQVVTGDLTFWGLTQQQAQDFANGVGGQRLVYQTTSAQVDSTTCSFIRCMFTYEPEPAVIAPPVLF